MSARMAGGSPPLGLKHSQALRVDASLTVPEVSRVSSICGSFEDMPPVFATAFMIGFIEATCIAALKPYLAVHQGTVGTHVNMSHSNATPIGMTVTAAVELVAVQGRRLRFRVECRDELDLIGAGEHERMIIDAPKFIARVEAKAARVKGP